MSLDEEKNLCFSVDSLAAGVQAVKAALAEKGVEKMAVVTELADAITQYAISLNGVIRKADSHILTYSELEKRDKLRSIEDLHAAAREKKFDFPKGFVNRICALMEESTLKYAGFKMDVFLGAKELKDPALSSSLRLYLEKELRVNRKRAARVLAKQDEYLEKLYENYEISDEKKAFIVALVQVSNKLSLARASMKSVVHVAGEECLIILKYKKLLSNHLNDHTNKENTEFIKEFSVLVADLEGDLVYLRTCCPTNPTQQPQTI